VTIQETNAAYQESVERREAGDKILDLLVAVQRRVKTEHQEQIKAAQAQAFSGEVPSVGEIADLADQIKFTEQAAEKYRVFEYRDLLEAEATADVALAKALLTGEEQRLAAHNAELAQAIRGLQKLTANPHLSVGGGATESEARANSDFVAQAHEKLVRDARANVRVKEAALEVLKAETLEMRRKYLRRYPDAVQS
jgi:hypothetical protein